MQSPQRLRLTALLLFPIALAVVSAAHAQPNRQPDLVVHDIVITPENPLPGDRVSVEAIIENAGDGDFRESFNVRFHLSLAPDAVAITFGAPINDFTVEIQRVLRGLKAGARTTVRFEWTVVEVPLIRVRVTADEPLDAVAEADERNNRLEKTIVLPEAALNQWWLDALDVRGAHALTRGSDTVVVAVIDTGIDWTHPEIAGRLWVNPDETPGNGVDDDGNGFIDDVHGWDFVDGDNNLGGTARHLHATAVAGILAAADDGVGTTGVAPGVRLMDVRGLDSKGFGEFDDISAAIRYAASEGADVINLSLGAPEDPALLCPPSQRPRCRSRLSIFLDEQEEAIIFAKAQGALVVASAGNDAAGVGYPARFDAATAVAATTIDNRLAGYSNRGPQVVVAAPGGALSEQQLINLFAFSASDFDAVVPQLASLIITPYPGAGYGWFSGTSAAASFVSGVAALVLSVNPGLSPDEVQAVLVRSATDLGEAGPDDAFGAGLVNARRAVEAAL